MPSHRRRATGDMQYTTSDAEVIGWEIVGECDSLCGGILAGDQNAIGLIANLCESRICRLMLGAVDRIGIDVLVVNDNVLAVVVCQFRVRFDGLQCDF
jgi:hypothetical protein